MKCGLIDLGCQVHKLIDPIWGFLFWGFWVVVALVVLGVLYRVKQLFGWQGVLAAIVAAGGVIIAIFSFKAGRDSVTKSEGDFDPPLRPKKPRKPKQPSDDANRPGTWNPQEGRWN